MNYIINNITETFKGLWAPPPSQSITAQEKRLIEGYHMSTDAANDKTLVLVKHGDNFWKTEWFDNSTTAYRAPILSLNELFCKT